MAKKAGRPTKWQQVHVLLDQVQGYLARAAQKTRLVGSKPHDAVAMHIQLTRDSWDYFQKHYNARMNKHEMESDRREKWAEGRTKCYCCYVEQSVVPIITTYILFDRKFAKAEEPWNWIRLCSECAGRLYGDTKMKYRMWLKHENDPKEYNFIAADKWFRERPCNKLLTRNWVNRGVVLPPRMRVQPKAALEIQVREP
jgi:hypothetical protein